MKQEHKDAVSACGAVQQFCHVVGPTGQHAHPSLSWKRENRFILGLIGFV